MSKTINDNADAQKFFTNSVKLLNKSEIPYLLAGAYSLYHLTGILRDTKDLDIFCKSGDFHKIIKLFSDKGYKTEITDERWLGKIFEGKNFIDIIYTTVNNLCIIDDKWFKNACKGEYNGIPVSYIGPEEFIWCKIFVQNRERYDAADINHMILKRGKKLNWKQLLEYVDQHWQLLLQQIINFMYVYPADRDIIPKWLFDELIERAKLQMELHAPNERVCRGPLIDQTQYKIDITEWDYKVITIKTI
jgi:hypothetical protein